jgi:hypothetical protein
MRLQQIRQGTQARIQHDIPTHDPLHAIEEPLELAKDRRRPLVSLARVRRRIRKRAKCGGMVFDIAMRTVWCRFLLSRKHLCQTGRARDMGWGMSKTCASLHVGLLRPSQLPVHSHRPCDRQRVPI